MINKAGFNPSLERRLNYKLIELAPGKGDSGCNKRLVNINYLIVDPVFEIAYRSDVKRVESSKQMAIKATDDVKPRPEEFVNVTTSYRELRSIMLSHKFEAFFSAKLNEDEAGYDP